MTIDHDLWSYGISKVGNEIPTAGPGASHSATMPLVQLNGSHVFDSHISWNQNTSSGKPIPVNLTSPLGTVTLVHSHTIGTYYLPEYNFLYLVSGQAPLAAGDNMFAHRVKDTSYLIGAQADVSLVMYNQSGPFYVNVTMWGQAPVWIRQKDAAHVYEVTSVE